MLSQWNPSEISLNAWWKFHLSLRRALLVLYSGARKGIHRPSYAQAISSHETFNKIIFKELNRIRGGRVLTGRACRVDVSRCCRQHYFGVLNLRAPTWIDKGGVYTKAIRERMQVTPPPSQGEFRSLFRDMYTTHQHVYIHNERRGRTIRTNNDTNVWGAQPPSCQIICTGSYFPVIWF